MFCAATRLAEADRVIATAVEKRILNTLLFVCCSTLVVEVIREVCVCGWESERRSPVGLQDITR